MNELSLNYLPLKHQDKKTLHTRQTVLPICMHLAIYKREKFSANLVPLWYTAKECGLDRPSNCGLAQSRFLPLLDDESYRCKSEKSRWHEICKQICGGKCRHSWVLQNFGHYFGMVAYLIKPAEQFQNGCLRVNRCESR